MKKVLTKVYSFLIYDELCVEETLNHVASDSTFVDALGVAESAHYSYPADAMNARARYLELGYKCSSIVEGWVS